MAYLILVRHGQSEWNKTGQWTGLTDIGLSEKGFEEAKAAGEKIRDVPLDQGFTSILSRSKQTLEKILITLNLPNLPTTENAALNERDYGEYTGKNKWEIEKEVGEERFQQIRRGFDVPISGGETLKNVFERVVPYYQSTILPMIEQGKNVIIAAHGNSLRALVKYLDNLSDERVADLEIPTGQVLVYQIDQDGKVVKKEIR